MRSSNRRLSNISACALLLMILTGCGTIARFISPPETPAPAISAVVCDNYQTQYAGDAHYDRHERITHALIRAGDTQLTQDVFEVIGELDQARGHIFTCRSVLGDARALEYVEEIAKRRAEVGQ